MTMGRRNSPSMDTKLRNNIEIAFRMLPETHTAVFEGEDGEIFAYGHVDKLDLVEDILHLWDYTETRQDNIEYGLFPTVGKIDYRHATLVSEGNFDPYNDDLYFNFCEPGHPEAFPLSVFNY